MSKRIKELRGEIRRHRQLYEMGNPELTDPQYDVLEKELKTLSPNDEIFDEVGHDIDNIKSTFAKVQHAEKMLSLDKIYSREEFDRWANSKSGKKVATPKMDGFALSLIYEKGSDGTLVLMLGKTRGKGAYGEDITENVKKVNDIPHVIKGKGLPEKLEVRGETYMKKSVFDKLVDSGEDFSNCRNIASGSVRAHDVNVTEKRNMNFFAYNALGMPWENLSQRLVQLETYGFKPVLFEVVSNEECSKVFEKWDKNRDKIDYAIDGVVFAVDNIKEQEALGATSHHPRAFIAWKFEAETGESVLKKVDWQVSRTGQINPVANYEGVFVDGATLTKATLHNLSEIERLGIGLGDKILIARQGGVIPKVMEVLKSAGGKIDIPSKCPRCGKKTEVRTSGSDAGGTTKVLFCTNDYCPAVQYTRILHFIKVLEIEDVGPSVLDKLMEAGIVEDSADLFNVTKEKFLQLESVREKSAEKHVRNIADARVKGLGTFLTALGIHSLGRTAGPLLEEKYKTLDAVLAADKDDLKNIEGIGPDTATYISEGLKENAALIKKLRKAMDIKDPKVKSNGGPLAGSSFLLTGTLSRPRKEIEKIIIKEGGEVKTSVSKALSYLIVGEKPGSKVDKAKKANVKMINEEEFLNLIGG